MLREAQEKYRRAGQRECQSATGIVQGRRAGGVFAHDEGDSPAERRVCQCIVLIKRPEFPPLNTTQVYAAVAITVLKEAHA